MSNLGWFILDMLVAGLNFGVAIRQRDNWWSILNWIMVFSMLALAAISFAEWLGG